MTGFSGGVDLLDFRGDVLLPHVFQASSSCSLSSEPGRKKNQGPVIPPLKKKEGSRLKMFFTSHVNTVELWVMYFFSLNLRLNPFYFRMTMFLWSKPALRARDVSDILVQIKHKNKSCREEASQKRERQRASLIFRHRSSSIRESQGNQSFSLLRWWRQQVKRGQRPTGEMCRCSCCQGPPAVQWAGELSCFSIICVVN